MHGQPTLALRLEGVNCDLMPLVFVPPKVQRNVFLGASRREAAAPVGMRYATRWVRFVPDARSRGREQGEVGEVVSTGRLEVQPRTC